MKTFYVLIGVGNGMHYGYTFDEERAKAESARLTREYDVEIDIYEFKPYEEF